MRLVVPLLLTALLVVGCGADAGDRTSDDRTRGARAVGGGDTELTVVLKAGNGAGRSTYVLTCDPPGGDHPNPEGACQALAGLEAPFAPVPADRACTEIYGGPQTARVTGTYRGEAVDATFDRTNGCEISRWDAHVALLVERGGAEGS